MRGKCPRCLPWPSFVRRASRWLVRSEGWSRDFRNGIVHGAPAPGGTIGSEVPRRGRPGMSCPPGLPERRRGFRMVICSWNSCSLDDGTPATLKKMTNRIFESKNCLCLPRRKKCHSCVCLAWGLMFDSGIEWQLHSRGGVADSFVGGFVAPRSTSLRRVAFPKK